VSVLVLIWKQYKLQNFTQTEHRKYDFAHKFRTFPDEERKDRKYISVKEFCYSYVFFFAKYYRNYIILSEYRDQHFKVNTEI
jgi:hypothetical protein